MRVRIMKPIVTALGGFGTGVVVNVSDKMGRAWCRAGLACQDKSLDGASETKVPKRKKGKAQE